MRVRGREVEVVSVEEARKILARQARLKPRGPLYERKRALDILCRRIQMLRAGAVEVIDPATGKSRGWKGTCKRCRRRKWLEWCHIFTRRILSTRWDLDNSFAGCSGCHRWWHDNPTETRALVLRWIGERRYDALRMRFQVKGRHPSLDLIELDLRRELARLEEGRAA